MAHGGTLFVVEVVEQALRCVVRRCRRGRCELCHVWLSLRLPEWVFPALLEAYALPAGRVAYRLSERRRVVVALGEVDERGVYQSAPGNGSFASVGLPCGDL